MGLEQVLKQGCFLLLFAKFKVLVSLLPPFLFSSPYLLPYFATFLPSFLPPAPLLFPSLHLIFHSFISQVSKLLVEML